MASFKDGFVVDPFVTVIVLGGATAATSLYLTPLSMLACVVAACVFVLVCVPFFPINPSHPREERKKKKELKWSKV